MLLFYLLIFMVALALLGMGYFFGLLRASQGIKPHKPETDLVIFICSMIAFAIMLIVVCRILGIVIAASQVGS